MDYENWMFHDVTPIYLQLCNKMSYNMGIYPVYP